jgi:ribonuclease E
MSKQMLIDASHLEETRVIVLNNKTLEEFECETSTKKTIKGNIYLARVVRVEPSLQAAFVDFGGARHGFLAFNEIHPDYYRVPVEDQEKLLQSLSENSREEGEEPEEGDFEEPQRSRFKTKTTRSYKIQEVIKKRQVILVQIVKDERGGKGAALSSYLSLPGRYCVLMPNTPRGGGVSRKITNIKDRKRLKEVMSTFDVMEGAGLILRTAGMGRTKLEIKRDYDYLLRLWEEIREKTINSQAPSLIYEEGNLITKAIRDLYSKEIDEILVDGEESYKEAKNLMRILMPSHAKKVRLYKDNRVPLFHHYGVEAKIDNIHLPIVHLPSGGYVVINPTEALVSIDVNSGKATRERHIEETALKTNLEAAEEIARQLRLRDLSGLIVIDFIDMDQSKNNTLVERAFREALKSDRARIQVGSISIFGLLEMSRQRLRPSLEETISMPCTHCRGTGMIRSVESSCLQILRMLEIEGIDGRFGELIVSLPTTVAFYLLNQKRNHLTALEKKYQLSIVVTHDDTLVPPDFRVEHIRTSERQVLIEAEGEESVPQDLEFEKETASESDAPAAEAVKKELSRSGRRRRRRIERKKSTSSSEAILTENETPPLLESSESEERHLRIVPKTSSEKKEDSEEKILEKSSSQEAGHRRRGNPKRHNTQGIRPLATLEGTKEASPELFPSEEEGNKRGSTRLKVGPGAARTFGRRYAKEGKETIRRVAQEIPVHDIIKIAEENPVSLAAAPVKPTPLKEKNAKSPSSRRTVKKTNDSSETIKEASPLPAAEKTNKSKTPLKKEAEAKTEKKPSLGKKSEGEEVRKKEGSKKITSSEKAPALLEPERIEKPPTESPSKKGWWKRLLES